MLEASYISSFRIKSVILKLWCTFSYSVLHAIKCKFSIPAASGRNPWRIMQRCFKCILNCNLKFKRAFCESSLQYLYKTSPKTTRDKLNCTCTHNYLFIRFESNVLWLKLTKKKKEKVGYNDSFRTYLFIYVHIIHVWCFNCKKFHIQLVMCNKKIHGQC